MKQDGLPPLHGVPDLVLTGGKILTADNAARVVEALAIAMAELSP